MTILKNFLNARIVASRCFCNEFCFKAWIVDQWIVRNSLLYKGHLCCLWESSQAKIDLDAQQAGQQMIRSIQLASLYTVWSNRELLIEKSSEERFFQSPD